MQSLQPSPRLLVDFRLIFVRQFSFLVAFLHHPHWCLATLLFLCGLVNTIKATSFEIAIVVTLLLLGELLTNPVAVLWLHTFVGFTLSLLDQQSIKPQFSPEGRSEDLDGLSLLIGGGFRVLRVRLPPLVHSQLRHDLTGTVVSLRHWLYDCRSIFLGATHHLWLIHPNHGLTLVVRALFVQLH